jgi:alpha,alpha-trehalase
MCWAALDRAVDLASALGAGGEQVSRWCDGRDEIRRIILDEGWNERAGAFSQTLRGDQMRWGVHEPVAAS